MTEDGDDGATRIFHTRRNFGDTYAEASAWTVPESDRYPDGVKYSLQYGSLEPAETIIRYDNFPDHKGAPRHHKHTESGEVVGVDYDGIRKLYQQFRQEVRDDHGEEWD
jgi:hypothetical protein